MADDVVLQEAVEALRGGNKTRARELLTGLVKTDQSNADYWVWMSASMETPKERIYCLQTALKLDPENVSAKRGLILLGALPADETIQPFQVNRPRTWEENLLLAHEKPKLKGWAAVKASPAFRLAIVVLIVGIVAGGITMGLIIPAMTKQETRRPTETPGPSPTFTMTVTAVGAKPQVQATRTPGGPLSELLEIPYTPTALYVPTHRSPTTSDFLLQFKHAYDVGDWDQAISALQNVTKNDETAIFAYYYIGECYRFKNDPGNAFLYYSAATSKDPNFGAGYVGMARARLLADPNTGEALSLLDEAIRLDPNFGEAYLERANVKIRDNDIQGAIADLGEANKRLPDSPLVYYALGLARLKEGDFEKALSAAKRSNELDVTSLPTYLLLGQIYAETEDYKKAVDSINIYLKYRSEDISTYFLLGKIQFQAGNYEESIRAMNKVIANDPARREPYLYRFLSNVELGKGAAADEDLDRALSYYPDSFDANLGLVRTHLLNNRNGSALVDLEKVLKLAETDKQKALAYYWAAVVYEQRNELKDAAGYWQQVLELPAESMTAEMRKVAEEHLLKIWTPTATLEPTETEPATPTKPVTATPTRTPTQTPSP